MAPDEDSRTLAEAGEFSVIDEVVRGRRQPAAVTVGPGDDGAVLTTPDGRVVVSTDMLVEGRHFRLDWSTPYDVGRKAIAQNAADIEAMGAVATGFVVGFGAPADTPVAAATALSDGLWAEAGAMGAGIAGGDMVNAPQWVVSVTVLGDLAGRSPVCRGGARPGDVVAVAGDLGHSAAGYRLWQEDVGGFDTLRRVHLVPRPPYGQGRVAADTGATAMTDVSDGLLADLTHLATASNCTIDVSRDLLGAEHRALTAAAAAVGADPWQWILGGGEDHALVATFPGDPPVGWRVIGRVLTGSPQVFVDGADWAGERGWQSY
ncbi:MULTISPECIES: thiamine-phosphate kinase [Mycobacteriaceae]|uniref:thiamine-phosphate kinase n=1 Tax=Mycobacteriaceae TaxID=1762 RepID=UPI0007FFA520|nr:MULTISPECIES: thiamine-phosphate kinase [Mycobacteriaceae]MCK0175038.1 thiamine-phosphate kinase [Mycolicibacterium sp. F2034L]OBB61333.1 thiamine-phosphate kinase [Mycobacterium sp. 852013-51886_SCH5428379]